MPVWDSRLSKVFIQPDGPGNPFYFTDNETDMEALGGGGISFGSDWGASDRYIGSRKTSNPGDVTGTITSRRYDAASRLRDIADNGCFCGVLAANGCTTLDVNDFNSALYLVDTGFTARPNTSARLSDRTPGENAKVNDTLPFRAAQAREWRRLNVGRIATGVAATYKQIIALGNKACAGCGTSNSGDLEFVAVSGAVSPATIPRINYTSDGGLTWKSCTLTNVTSGVAESVTKIGDRILIAVSGASGGVWQISYATLKSAATTTAITATASTGITLGTQSFWRVLAVGNTVFASAGGGQVWISKDRGYSFTQLNHGLTADTLFNMAAYDENLVYFGGPTNAMLVYTAGAFTLVTIPNTSAVMAVPPRNPSELYFAGASGTLIRSRDGLQTFETIPYLVPAAGAASVNDMQFVGDRGELFFFSVVNSGGAAFSNLYVDRSGGAGGAAVQLLRNVAITGSRFAMSSANYGLTDVTPGGATASYFERISG